MAALAITFDDGPDQHWTPVLLDRLAAHGARATFFVMAPLAESHPDLLAKMVRDGHTVGLHCEQHVRHSKRDRSWLEADTECALRRLRALGITPRLWRTPWGDTAPWTEEIARRHGLQVMGWSVDTHDWRGDSAAQMFADTRDQLEPSAVVLAHDGIGPGARRAGAAETILYLDLLARHAAERGLTLEALT